MPQDPAPTPEFAPGTRFFIWKANNASCLCDLAHLAAANTGSRVFGFGYRLRGQTGYDLEHLRVDQLSRPELREWQELTFEGFNTVMREQLGTFTEALPTLIPFLVFEIYPFIQGVSDTDHRIGAPKNKLP